MSKTRQNATVQGKANATKRRRRKPTTLVIQTEGQTYADMLKKIKAEEEVKILDKTSTA